MIEERQRDRISKKLLIKAEDTACTMVDMSRAGMRLIMPVLVKKPSFDISFQMENLLLNMTGIVRWIKKEPTVYEQARYQVGLYLVDPPEEYIHLIESLLQES
jgi:hypothetical protein